MFSTYPSFATSTFALLKSIDYFTVARNTYFREKNFCAMKESRCLDRSFMLWHKFFPLK